MKKTYKSPTPSDKSHHGAATINRQVFGAHSENKSGIATDTDATKDAENNEPFERRCKSRKDTEKSVNAHRKDQNQFSAEQVAQEARDKRREKHPQEYPGCQKRLLEVCGRSVHAKLHL